MLVSPFTFFRGAASVMAADLVGTPRSGVTVQLCGDAHLSNFGLFGSPERRMLFDINDFDETLPGPWEWNVKRLAASFEVMGRDRGFTPADRHAIVMAGLREYRDRMRRAAGMSGLQAWYEHLEAGELLQLVRQEVAVKRVKRREARAHDDMVAKARSRDSTRVLARRAGVIDGELRIVADPPIIVPVEDLARPGTPWDDPAPAIKKLLASYRRTLTHHHHPLEEYRYVHAARKVVGVGSVGTRCYILLLVGRDNDDPLFLQIKEAQPSVLERFLGPSAYPNHGQRVVVGQRLMQAATDIFLGWQRITGLDGVTRDYYVRQFHDWKGSADVDTMQVPGAILYSASVVPPSAAPTPAGGTASPSRPTSAREPRSTAPSHSSPRPMPTKTNATMPRSPRPPRPDGSWLRPACSRRTPGGCSGRSACMPNRRLVAVHMGGRGTRYRS
jgi:uncharacterized protein (DUF2252 family)